MCRRSLNEEYERDVRLREERQSLNIPGTNPRVKSPYHYIVHWKHDQSRKEVGCTCFSLGIREGALEFGELLKTFLSWYESEMHVCTETFVRTLNVRPFLPESVE